MDLKNFLSMAGLTATLLSGPVLAETTELNSCSPDLGKAVRVEIQKYDGCSIITLEDEEGNVLNANCGCGGGTCNGGCKGVCW